MERQGFPVPFRGRQRADFLRGLRHGLGGSLIQHAAAYGHERQIDAAAASYWKALMLAGQGPDADLMRPTAVAANFLANRGLSVYRRLRTVAVFEQLALAYQDRGNADGLTKLVAARRADAPADPSLIYWDAVSWYLRGRYPEAAQQLKQNRARILAPGVKPTGFAELLVRCLARAGKFDDALRESAAYSETGEPSAWHVALIESIRGNAPAASGALERVLARDQAPGQLSMLYADPDLGPALRSSAMAEWRKAHPDPRARSSQSASAQ